MQPKEKLLADPNFCFVFDHATNWPLASLNAATDIKGLPKKRGPDNPCTGQNDRHEAGETVRPASSKSENN